MKPRRQPKGATRAGAKLRVLLALALVVQLLGLPVREPARAQVRPVYDEGAVGLGLLLRRLQTTASVLHVGAHPDDEDSGLIARLARGDGARVAYLSLNRGEGGQNRIGPELFDALGVIRTEELLQARRLDGGQQFFTRSFDFGFTKTLEEARARWDERALLADAVRVIRTFRPLVVVSRWRGTPEDGHGQHQFSGWLAPLAFRAAADPAAFPEQLAEGLRPWQARKLFVSESLRARNGQAAGEQVLRVETGTHDPLIGRSLYELAVEGRSYHRSQEQGGLELRGAQASGVRLVDHALGSFTMPGSQMFDPIDTSIRGITRAAGMAGDPLADVLTEVQRDAALALEKFNANDPRTVVAALAAGLAHTREARERLASLKLSEPRAEPKATEPPKPSEPPKTATPTKPVDPPKPAEQTKAAEQSKPVEPPSQSPAPSSLMQTDVGEFDRLTSKGQEDARAEADFLLAAKEREFADALRLATGFRLDALADAETVARGESFNVVVRAYAPDRLAQVVKLSLRAPRGWRVEEVGAPERNDALQIARESASVAAYFRVTVPRDAELTQPYWLRAERRGDMYEWSKDDPQTLPFAPPPLVAEAAVDFGAQTTFERAVEYRHADAVRGELRRELNVVPEIDVRLTPKLVIVPLHAAGRAGASSEFALRVRNNLRASGEDGKAPNAFGAAEVRGPEGWPLAPPQTVQLAGRGDTTTLKFKVPIPRGLKAGEYGIDAKVGMSLHGPPGHGIPAAFVAGEQVLAYPHIQTHRVFARQSARLLVFDLRVAPVRVGYVMGSGDEVPAAVERMGLQVTLLDEAELAAGDLSRFDVIIAGVRASQARPDFVANHKRLVQFVERGGTLVVQYQRPDYAALGLPPFPATMETRDARGAQSISRVVDETAEVRVLDPAHPVFNKPNRITADDWRGWVQERNLYNFVALDPRYAPLLESHDAGEPENSGGLVHARVGRGHYVYASYSFFRQLPAGVPGAYRLFANLLSLPKTAPPGASKR